MGMPAMPSPIPGLDEGGTIHDWLSEHAGAIGASAAGLGATAAAFASPRHANALARPILRALAKPMFSAEGVSKVPLSDVAARARFNAARGDIGGKFGNVEPGETTTGAWMGDNGMEHNQLFNQEMPRRPGWLHRQDDIMGYAGQMGEHLSQDAMPVSRFVPHVINDPEGANAMMVSGVDDAGLRDLSGRLSDLGVTVHRPGNKMLAFPYDVGPISAMAARISGKPIRYGVSNPLQDRVALTKSPQSYTDWLYSDVGAGSPRQDWLSLDRRLQGIQHSTPARHEAAP